MNITPEIEKAYVEKGGTRCPFCGSENITGGGVNIDAGGATQEVGCDDCGAEWADCYTLSGIITLR